MSTYSLVHEEISCPNILLGWQGEVKISDVDSCKFKGDPGKFSESFSRLVMKLMDKEKDPGTIAVGLTHPEQWSTDAINMLTFVVLKPGIEKILGHDFMKKRNQKSLASFVPYVLVAAAH